MLRILWDFWRLHLKLIEFSLLFHFLLDLRGVILALPQIHVSVFSNSDFSKLLFESFPPHTAYPLPILVILESLLGDDNFSSIEQLPASTPRPIHQFSTPNYCDRDLPHVC
jgi:hypothetical protein